MRWPASVPTISRRTWSGPWRPALLSWIRPGVDDVFFGDASGAGEDNRDVARMAVLLAGLPTSVPGVT